MSITDPVRSMWRDYFTMLKNDVVRWWVGIGTTPAEKVRLAEEAIAEGDRMAEVMEAMLTKAKKDWSREWKLANGVGRGTSGDNTGDDDGTDDA